MTEGIFDGVLLLAAGLLLIMILLCNRWKDDLDEPDESMDDEGPNEDKNP